MAAFEAITLYLLMMINGSRGPTIDVGDVTPRTPAPALFPYLLTAGLSLPDVDTPISPGFGPWLASHGQELTRELYDAGSLALTLDVANARLSANEAALRSALGLGPASVDVERALVEANELTVTLGLLPPKSPTVSE